MDGKSDEWSVSVRVLVHSHLILKQILTPIHLTLKQILTPIHLTLKQILNKTTILHKVDRYTNVTLHRNFSNGKKKFQNEIFDCNFQSIFTHLIEIVSAKDVRAITQGITYSCTSAAEK